MKKTGLEIVEMIAKGKAPRKIKHKWEDWEIIYTYNKETNSYEYDSSDDLDLIQFLNDEFEIIEEQKVWKPKDDERYYYIDSSARNVGINETLNGDFSLDKALYEVGNCFKTKEEAEKTLEKIKIYTQLKRYAEEHNTEKIDWNKKKWRYYIQYNRDTQELSFDMYQYTQDICQIYFTSKELCKQAIKEIGEDNIKKLFED